MADSPALKYRFREYELDLEKRQLTQRGVPLPVGQLTLDLLAHLLDQQHRVVGKQELRELFWADRNVGASTIPTAINAVRTAIGDSATSSELVKTVYGRGYRWILPCVPETGTGGASPAKLAARRGFFGRERDLESLEALLDRDMEESCSVAVRGEAGVGKTRLLEEFAHLARRRGVVVLEGRCAEGRGAPPYWPWMQVLQGLSGESLADVRATLDLRPVGSRENADVARFDLFQAISGRFAAAAIRGPLVVIIDDVHLADLPSIRLLEAVCALFRPSGLRLVFAYRQAEMVARGDDVAGVLARLPTINSIALSGLSLDDSRQLLEVYESLELSDELVRTLVARTGGNPFFLSQMASFLSECTSRDEAELLDRAKNVAPSIGQVLNDRLDDLSEDIVLALSGASALGREFDSSLLAVILHQSEVKVLDSLDQAVRLGLVERCRRRHVYRFIHVLVRDVLYERLSSGDRADLHAAALQGLREKHGVLAGDVLCDAARHSLAVASAGGSDTALSLLQDAASWSEENLGFEEAVSYLEDAADLLDRSGADPKTRVDVLVRLAGAQRRSGQQEAAALTCRRAAAFARSCDDPNRLAQVALEYAPGFFAIEAGVVDEFLIGALEEVRSFGEDCRLDLLSRAVGQLAIALYWSPRHAECAGLAEEAEKQAERSGDPAARVFAATAREVATWGPGGARERAELAEWARQSAEAGGDREMELVYRLYRIAGLFQMGEFERAFGDVAEFSRQAVESLNPSALWYRDLFGALEGMMLGRWDQAEECCRRFTALGAGVNDRNAENSSVIHSLYREIEFGDLARGVEIADSQARKFPRLKAYQCARAFFLAGSGRTDEAREQLARLVTRTEVRVSRTAEWLVSVGLLAEACAYLGDRRRAQTLLEALEPFEDEYLVVVFAVCVWRPVNYFLGRLAATSGDLGRADLFFEKAEAQAREIGALPWLAHAQLGHAELLRKRAWAGDGRRARGLAIAAEATAQELRMKPLMSRCRAFLWGRHSPA